MLNLQEKYRWNVEDVIPANLQSAVLYEEVFPNVDLQYTAFGHNIKEQIIVKEPQSSYRFDFLLTLKGLTASLNEDGSVSLVNVNDEVIYTIPTPYMVDGDGALSSDVFFTLNETNQGVVLSVEADAAWMNAEERVYPVMIDPSFVIVSGQALDEIYSVYTMEAAPNTPTLGRQYLYVGAQPYSKTNDGRYRLFMHFQNMPAIPAGSEVVDAQLSLYQHQYTQRYCPSFPIGVYEVTTSLPSAYSSYYNWFTKMTWKTAMPSYDTTNCIDYVMVDSTKGYRTWNMTELVKKWYAEGTRNTTAALVMMNEDAIDTYYYFASATFYAYAGVHPPVLAVSYRNNTGIEPYYTYATLGAGAAGTAYIADRTGQLKIAKELISYASSTNPFSLNLVYNSDYFSRSESDFCPPANLGLSMNVGSGWTLDCIQRIVPETISNISYLKYTDGDGTIHYFCKDSSKDSNYYYDEDGLGLKIQNTGTNAYTMSDDKGNEWIFTGSYLTSIKDSDGNAINISYSGGQITSISQVNQGQSSITVASFTYSGNQLTSVTDAAGNTYTLTYSGTNLVSIKRGSTGIASYEYSGYRAAKMTDSESGYGIAFTYANGKVASYQEKSGSSTGASVTVTYPNHTQTVYRDHGADRTANTADDILTYYLFDYAGRTANAYTTDSSGNVLGASNAAYSSSGSTDKTNNRTLRSASIGIAGQQLLRNTSVESTDNAWSFSGASRASTKARTGSYAVKAALSGSGTQYAQKASESLTSGITYTFSGYVNTSEVTSFVGSGVYLKVTDGSGNTWTSNPVNYATASTVDDGWVRVSVSFTAKSSGAHTVGVYIDGAAGSCYADDFQLEKGEAPSSHNLVENGSMQMSSHGWTMGTGAGIDASTGAAGSSASLKISGDPESTSTNAYQDIPLNLPGSQTYVLSGWVYANAVPDSDPSSATGTSKKCGLRATITYSDGGTEAHYASFNSDLSKNWQFTSMTIVPKQSGKTVASIRVTCAYEGNANVAYFDNISLLREAAQTMRYDADGNLVSVNSPGLKEDTNTYSGGNLIKTVTGGNGTYTYTYDTTYTHRLKSVSNGQITQTMGYDGTGNVTSTTLSGSGGKCIQTSASYTGNGNRLDSVTDAAGASVTYGYGNANSQMMGLPTSVTDPYGTVTTSAYDANGRVTQTSVADSADLMYTYKSGNLSTVKRTDSGSSAQTYGFTYDSFGNMLTAKVGNRTLATYNYGGGNGLLTKQTYANGDSVSFTYDSLGRTKTAVYADGRTLTYTYNGEGRLHSVTEEGGGSDPVTYLYTYDSLGRLISSEQKNGAASTLRTSQTYNDKNQLTKQAWQVGSTAYAEDYTYNTSDGSLNTMTTGVGTTLTMGYDGLRRLMSVSGGPVTRQYTYRDISGTQTTMQVSSVTSGGKTYGYTYDKAGNIASYTAPGRDPVAYTYDDQGQLLSATGNGSYTYTYDTVGNILSASDGTTVHSYTYGDIDWKDLLTAFDGEGITYDASGNPLSYYNGIRWSFTWSNGRRLASATATTDEKEVTVAYAYDADGQRVGKTVTTKTYRTHSHSYTATVVEPTCTEGGYTVYTCDCGDSYTEDETEALGHDYVETEEESGICRTCSRCGDTYMFHEHSYTKEVVSPTCTEGGYTVYTCDCGKSYTEDETEALGHDYVETEEESGIRRTCSRCGDTYMFHEHSYTKEVVSPTCTEGGYTVYTCDCGKSYTGDETEALGHDYVETEEESGIRRTCSRCGDTYMFHEHSYTATVVEPTCTEGGYTVYTCDCGKSYTGDETEALGHDYVETEEESGIRRTCSRCGDTYMFHEHSYTKEVVSPTCTEGGYTVYTCDCGNSYTGDETEALGHDYVETEEESGIRRTCSRCGDTYMFHEHSYTKKVVSPTCTEGGYTSHVCSCGKHYEDERTPALGHSYYVKKVSNGMNTYVCRRCGDSYVGPAIEIPPDPNRPVVMSLGEGDSTEAVQGERELISTVTETHVYIYASGCLLRETVTTTDGEISSTQTMDFFYDASGAPYALKHNGTVYYYITNLQGDVTHLVDATGTPVAAYEYDPYGNVITADGTLAQINPLRYRGYYYDNETGMYYLQSRYYDPAVGRFINADEYVSTGQGIIGNNMFTYCNNNPLMYSDYTGAAPEAWHWLVSGAAIVAGIAMTATGVGGALGGALICAGFNSIIGGYINEGSGGSYTAGWVGGGIAGIIGGAGASYAGTVFLGAAEKVGVPVITSLLKAVGFSFATGFAGSLAGNGVTSKIDSKPINTVDALKQAGASGTINVLSGYGGGISSTAFYAGATGIYRTISAGVALITESICDGVAFLMNLFS